MTLEAEFRRAEARERPRMLADLRRYLIRLRTRTGDRSWRVEKRPYYAAVRGNWRAVLINKGGIRRRMWYAYFRYWRVQ